MALFAKAGRFQEDKGSGLGPGDYDPCLPKSTGFNAGACSLGFTAPKAALSPSPRKRDVVPEDQEQDSFPVQDKRAAGSLTLSGHAMRPSQLPTGGMALSPTRQSSRLVHVELEQQVFTCVCVGACLFVVVHIHKNHLTEMIALLRLPTT